ncbi:MAG TPA: DUF1552 domain-containing protein [Polyangiaceae bacterium]|nr:DUF1552 domain-containing protein [Polyangiaceae bacterium]
MGNLSRRDFARNAALVALCSPFINLLQPSRARAATGKAKYFLLFVTNGRDPSAWKHSGSDSSLTLCAQTEPLSPIKSNLTIIEKLNSNGTAASHGSPGGLCGNTWGASQLISIEQFVSDSLKANGVNTQVPNIVLGGAEGNQPTTFWRANNAITPIYSPVTAFQALFGNFSGGGGTTTGAGGASSGDTAAADHLKKRKKSMLALINGDINLLKSSLGTEEQKKLQLHLDSLSQLETRINQTMTGGTGGGGSTQPSAGCKAPAKPTLQSQPFLNSSVHLDLAINAFACDITRVAAVQFGHHQMCPVDVEGAKGDYHNDFMHSDPAPHSRLANCEKYLAGQFLAAANKLKAIPAADGSGTLFDQTIMLWARDMGDAPNHTGDDMAYVFSGGAGGYLKAGGRFINGNGASHQRVFFNVCEAMGITNFSKFGDAAQSHDPLAGVGA